MANCIAAYGSVGQSLAFSKMHIVNVGKVRFHVLRRGL